jgi:hypothetical protein
MEKVTLYRDGKEIDITSNMTSHISGIDKTCGIPLRITDMTFCYDKLEDYIDFFQDDTIYLYIDVSHVEKKVVKIKSDVFRIAVSNTVDFKTEVAVSTVSSDFKTGVVMSYNKMNKKDKEQKDKEADAKMKEAKVQAKQDKLMKNIAKDKMKKIKAKEKAAKEKAREAAKAEALKESIKTKRYIFLEIKED